MFSSTVSYRCLLFGVLSTALALGVALTGCGKPANGRLEVSGTVTLDGEPLDQGSITFKNADPKLPSSGALILNGSFHIPDGKGLLPGEYKVAVDAPDEGGETGTPGGYTMVIPLSRIPEKYNAKTTLTAQVKPEGENRFVFDLSTRQ